MFHSRRKKQVGAVGTMDQLDSAALIPEELQLTESIPTCRYDDMSHVVHTE